jgi:hypothetical protein
MRGGRRQGAGRKPGSGLAKRTRKIAERATATGNTPLEYMLAVMRDIGADVKRRDEMAKAAAPFIHPRLAAVEHSGDEKSPLVVKIVRYADDQPS